LALKEHLNAVGSKKKKWYGASIGNGKQTKQGDEGGKQKCQVHENER